MDPLSLLAVLRARRRLAAHDTWSRAQLEAHQARALAQLRAHAYRHSPFYARFHSRVTGAPLEQLPVLTKAMLMEHFDELVTDPEVRRADVETYLRRASATDRYLGRYRVSVTGGTSGVRGIFLSNAQEWIAILASYARAYAWAGVELGLTHPLRTAIVSSRAPSHQSSIVGATVRNPLVRTLRLDAVDPLPSTVEALNAFQPQALVGYASILAALAREQGDARLRIRPRAVFSASEVLSPTDGARMAAAWGSDPFDVYAATEAATIASECRTHHLHLYEDMVIAEAVDREYRPVPPGETADKLLVTVLFTRTQPLIRYELDDRVRTSASQRWDHGPFRTIEDVEGRTEDELQLPGRDGAPVRVHPNVFHQVLDPLDAPWQVISHPDRLEILVQSREKHDALGAALTDALARLGMSSPRVVVRHVDQIPRTVLGKRPLVVESRRRPSTLSAHP